MFLRKEFNSTGILEDLKTAVIVRLVVTLSAVS